MKTLDEYQILLSQDEIDRLNEATIQFDDKLVIAKPTFNNLINDMLTGVFHVKEQLNEYNFKIINLDTNYKYLYAYYEKTKGIDIYQNLENENITEYHLWFRYECESLLSRLMGLVDAIHHILKIQYELKATAGPGFNQKVLNELKSKKVELYIFIEHHLKDERFKKIRKMRNDIIHNQSPLITRSMLETDENHRSFRMKDAHGYITPKEMIDFIKEYRDWLEEFTIELRKYILQ